MEYGEENVYQICKARDIHTLDRFLQSGLDVNYIFTSTADSLAHGNTLLHFAVAQQDVALVRFLIHKDCDINKAVQCVGCQGKKSRIKVKRGQDKLQWTCLFRAICMQDVEILRLVVQGGADVNLFDRSACSALWHAVDTNNYKITKVILESPNCDVNIQDTFMMSPLHVAATHNNCDMIQDLLDRKALVDSRQLQGASPLYLSCAYGDLNSVKLFLQHGADPNLQDKDGYTPIFAALDKGNNPDVVYLLVSAGTSLYSRIIFYTVKYLPLLVEHKRLCQFVKEHLDTAQSLKILSTLKIKDLLRHNSRGLSIYKNLTRLPLPKVMIDYLQLNKW